MADESKIAKLRKLEKKKSTFFLRAQHLFDLIPALKSQESARNNFLIRYQTLSETRDQFYNLVEEINDLTIDIDSNAEANYEALGAFDDLFGAIVIAHEKLIAETETLKPNPSTSKTSSSPASFEVQTQLPRIQIKPFTGKINDWSEYRDLFTSVIINNVHLSDAQKYHYLRTSLEPDALKIINGFPLSSENFKSAWNALEERFNNKRLLSSYFIEQMIHREKPYNHPSLKGLQSFLTQFHDAVIGLNNLKVNDLSDSIILNLALRRLDPLTVKAFEREQVNVEFPKYTDLVVFVKSQLKILEITAASSSSDNVSQPSSKSIEVSKPKSSRRVLLTNSNSQNSKPNYSSSKSRKALPYNSKSSSSHNNQITRCSVCQSSDVHPLYKCDQFKKLSVDQKMQHVKHLNACFNCLSLFHKLEHCRSSSRCSKCSALHHSLIHSDLNSFKSPDNLYEKDTFVPEVTQSQSVPSNQTINALTSFATRPNSDNVVLLATALINLRKPNGEYATIRALIDPASTRSCITQKCSTLLGLPLTPGHLPFDGLGGVPVVTGCGLVSCTLKPRHTTGPRLKTEAVVVQTIVGPTPPSSLPLNIIQNYSDLLLADPSFGEPGPVDFLLGADLFLSILTPLPNKNLSQGVLDTIFGAVVMGPIPVHQNQVSLVSCLSMDRDNLSKTLNKFWEAEEVPNVNISDPAEDICEQHFKLTFKRNSEGRYIVRLPFKNSNLSFPQSKEVAKNRFLSLERRLLRQADLKSSLTSFLDEYSKLVHMEPALEPAKYYLPYFCVHNPNSITTPVRVVFDGSAKRSDRSLNDTLYPGPKLQKEVPIVISNFRLHTFVFCCDIVKMFRQILIAPEDRCYQHIFFRKNPDEPLQEFQLNTVTYGLAPSPYQAQRVLIQLVKDEGTKYPLASKVILEDAFMDDLVTGSNSLEGLIETSQELIQILRAGGFHLSKWISNSTEFLSHMQNTSFEPLIIKDSPDKPVKVLGICWEPSIDSFTYKINSPTPLQFYTKRSILSMIAGIYDPIGFIAPLTFKYKSFMQTLWKSDLSWDDQLSSELCETWTHLTKNLAALATLQIPRRVLSLNYVSAQIIGFSDASEKGYGCVIYLRSWDECNKPQVSFLIAKSKVAPLKPTTIPRLELAGALLLSRTLFAMKSVLAKINIEKTLLYTDSTIVLSWLQRPLHTLKMYVANRVSSILEYTAVHQWNHVRTDHNPADMVSRGLDPLLLVTSQEWFQGPSWLYFPPSDWPQSVWTPVLSTDLPELKHQDIVLVAKDAVEDIPWMKRLSSFYKIQRVQAYISRFISNCRQKIKSLRTYGSFTITELRHSLSLCVLQVQLAFFHDEIKLIKQNKLKSSRLLPLSPFIDTFGYVRVGGRLKNARVSFSSKHPLLLPKHSHFTHLLIDSYHLTYLHAGPRTLRSLIQNKFWILSAHSVIRQRLRLCIICSKFTAATPSPIMAHLPEQRVNPSRPFSNCGIDLAGPFLLKESLRKKPSLFKAYFSLFICMATKAVHLEVLTSLSTEAFLATLSRFVARRGLPSTIFCDQGSNFRGAARELREINAFLRDTESNPLFLSELWKKEVTFKFICPKSPFMGGIWESNIKNVKFHLKRVVGNQILSLEEFITLLTRIESILNSRPLCEMSSSPNEPEALTPGHFLIGSSLISPPEYPLIDLPVNRLSRWQMVSSMMAHYWKRWSNEYLLTLQQRAKWFTSANNLESGQVVWIKDDGASPLTYPLGIIEEVYPNPLDRVVRSVSVRTSNGLIQRPVRKLAPLPLKN